MSIRNKIKSMIVGTEADIDELEKINDLKIRKNRSLFNIRRIATDEEIKELEQDAEVHKKKLIIDKIKADREVQNQQSKQRKKDTKIKASMAVIFCSCIISTVLSSVGISEDVKGKFLYTGIFLMLSATLLNGFYLQNKVFTFISRYARKDILSVLKVLFGVGLSLGLTYASIYTNILFVQKITDKWTVIILFSATFDLVPLWINLVISDFKTMHYNEETQELYKKFDSIGENKNNQKTTEKQPSPEELKTSQNIINRGFGWSDEEEKQPTNDQPKTTRKQPENNQQKNIGVSGRPVENLTQEEFNELVLSTFKNEQKVTPSPLGLTYNGTYQRLRNNCPYIKKEGKNYIMESNTIKLVKNK